MMNDSEELTKEYAEQLKELSFHLLSNPLIETADATSLLAHFAEHILKLAAAAQENVDPHHFDDHSPILIPKHMVSELAEILKAHYKNKNANKDYERQQVNEIH